MKTKEERIEARAARKAAREAKKSYVPTDADIARSEYKSSKVARGCMIALTVAVVGGLAATTGCCIYAAVKDGNEGGALDRDAADDAAESLGLCRSTDVMY